MKEFIDQEGLKARLVAMDIACFLEREPGCSSPGNAVLALAQEIKTLAENCNGCPEGQKSDALQVLTDKVRCFAKQCREFAKQSAPDNNTGIDLAWWGSWFSSRSIND